MYKATRELINQRQKHCEFILEHVSIERRPTMPKGRCARNSHELMEQNNDELALVSGWLVFPYNSLDNSTEIVQHWWNFSLKDKIHFDVTIGDFEKCEYVMDLSLYQYATQNHDALASTVGKSLLLKNGNFQAIEEISGVLNYSEIQSLETKYLFRHL
jgi:hypothetical protein